MRVQITIKLTPESRGEMIDKFGGEYRDFREYLERLAAQGVLPTNTEFRWLLDSGRWE